MEYSLKDLTRWIGYVITFQALVVVKLLVLSIFGFDVYYYLFYYF